LLNLFSKQIRKKKLTNEIIGLEKRNYTFEEMLLIEENLLDDINSKSNSVE
jgi:hypothetical protein